MRKGVLWLPVDHDLWPDAVLQLADVAHHVLAVLHDLRGPQLGVDNPVPPLALLALVHDLRVWLAAEMQREVLLRDQPRAYPRAEMLIQKARHVLGRDVLPSLEKPARENADGVAMRVDEVGHDLRELDLVLEGCDVALGPGEQRGQAVHVV